MRTIFEREFFRVKRPARAQPGGAHVRIHWRQNIGVRASSNTFHYRHFHIQHQRDTVWIQSLLSYSRDVTMNQH